MSYLSNKYCRFKKITKFDTTVKKDIICISIFKMRGGGYKDFSLYIDSLKYINDNIQKYENLCIRLTIDSNIEKDEKIMKHLKSLNRVSIVVFECSDFYENGSHYSTFGTIVRFFPMFKFKNNDAKRVIVMDADLMNNLFSNIMMMYDYV